MKNYSRITSCVSCGSFWCSYSVWLCWASEHSILMNWWRPHLSKTKYVNKSLHRFTIGSNLLTQSTPRLLPCSTLFLLITQTKADNLTEKPWGYTATCLVIGFRPMVTCYQHQRHLYEEMWFTLTRKVVSWLFQDLLHTCWSVRRRFTVYS